MLKNSDGFAVYEAVLALTCILFLCLSILPLLLNVISKVEESKDRATSWVVLYEQIQRIRVTGQASLQPIEREGITFHLIWDENERICVDYETRSFNNVQTCSETKQ